MTHLSDYSFLQRAVSLSYLYFWFMYRIWTLDRFQCLHPNRFRQGELKSIVTLLILFMIPFQLLYDVTSCKIKYEEGFASIFGHVFTKPETMWTKADQGLVIPTDYSLCVGFSLQTGTLLLLQCFWNYLANSVAKASFMSSREFLFYIVWTCVSIIMFPVLQYNFSRDVYDPTYKEIMPELIYGVELFIIAILGFISHFRFQKVLNNSRESNNARSITHKIRYFQELNLMLAIILLDCALSFIILSADGLTGRKYLNAHKFTADFMICNINVTSMIAWFIVILIFHPKPLANGAGSSMQQPAHDFLSSAKPLDGFPGAPAPTALMVQPSQASSDYLHYTESVITVPIHYSGTNSNTNTNHNSGYQRGPLPPPPNSDGEQPLSPSSTPSTATLVSHRFSGRRKDTGAKEIDQSSPPHVSVNLNDDHRLDEADWNASQITATTNDSKGNSNIRRQNSNDSMWLQQTPRGGNR
ncbi:hypothetical protein BJV82DRAFT_648177 [Fennellomyces sp. T-0311]|nr:hypothetical protein BJV82DRAFT_648177 [Fennellomyces sp. T-0311]